MIVNFMQGIARYPNNNGVQSFLVSSNDRVTLNTTNGPTDVVFTYGANNYLFTETSTTQDAWGPLPVGVDSWLYWDINLRTAERTFGFTTVAPLYGPTGSIPQSPAGDQHYFDTIQNKMYVFDGVDNRWKEKLRVFAAKVNNSSFTALGAVNISITETDGTITVVPNQYPYSNTQVGIQEPNISVGRILFDNAGIPVKKTNGAFFTTEDDIFINGSPTTAVRLESNIIFATANENIPKHHVVYFTSFGHVSLATYNNVGTDMVAMAMEDITKDEVGTLCYQGKIIDNDWNYAPAGQQLWVSTGGTLVATDPRASDPITYPDPKPYVARVLEPNVIIFDSSGSVGGGIGPQGPKGDKGDPGIVDMNAIVDEVLLRLSASTLTSINITGGTTTTFTVGGTPTAVNNTVTATFTKADGTTTTTANASPITWTVTAGASNGTLTTNTSTSQATFTPNSSLAAGSYTVTLEASYTSGGVTVTDTQTITITVLAADALSSITITGNTTNSFQAGATPTGTNHTVTATYVRGDSSTYNTANVNPITWTITAGASNATLTTNTSTSQATLTPNNTLAAGSYPITIQASYTSGGVTKTDTHTVTITVTSATIVYYGVANGSTAQDAAFVTSLTSVAKTAVTGNYNFTSPVSTFTHYMYIAYPASLGSAVKIKDAAVPFDGVWAGRTGTGYPKTISVTVGGTAINYYLYESDAPLVSADGQQTIYIELPSLK